MTKLNKNGNSDWKTDKEWIAFYEINQKDGYSRFTAEVAKKVMEFLDTYKGPFAYGYNPTLNTVHTIICNADPEGQLSVAQAGFVVKVVHKLHPRGVEFYEAERDNYTEWQKLQEVKND